jgi:hypothetical protein
MKYKLITVEGKHLRRLVCIDSFSDVKPKADRVAIAAAYGLDAPTGDHEQMVDEIIKGWGLGGFVFYLRSGKKLAAKRKQTPAWSHVQDAYKTIQNYSRFG